MKEAHNYATQFGLTGFHNGDVDAFRHAYASAEMTREFGQGWARALGDLNELRGDWNGQPVSERNMDLWNNAKGRAIGETSTDPNDTAFRVLEDLTSGNLIRSPVDPRTNPGGFPAELQPFAYPPDSGFPGTMEIEGWPITSEDDATPMPTAVNTSFMGAMSWTAPGDPLVLDLDGDGIEATAIDPGSLVLFDQDADGTRTATGWIRPDDGIVVMDLNGNGAIDSGRELFGDNTLLPNGSRAANGFLAIAQYDADANGSIDDADAAYSQLRVWQDVNQDGVSQAGELKTLSELGIASINVTGQASNITLGNGNSQPWCGNFTRTDGTTGASGTPELSGSLLLASNNFYREFTAGPALTDASTAMPQVNASGWVRDLREAMSLTGTPAEILQDKVAQFAAADSRDAQIALLDGLIASWAATTGRLVSSTYRYNMIGSNGVLVTTDLTSYDASAIILTLHPQGMEETVYDPVLGTIVRPTADGSGVLHRLNILEVFNGDKFVRMAIPEPSTGGGGASEGGGGGGSGSEASASQASATLSSAQIDLLNQSYDQLRDFIYRSLVVQTRLASYLDSVDFLIDQSGLSFDTTAMEGMFDQKAVADPRNALIDLIELNQYAQPTLQALNFDGLTKLQGWIDALPAQSDLRAELAVLHVFTGAASAGTAFADIYFGDTAANSFAGGAGDDAIVGGGGNDNLQGGTGDDTFDGGAGNDVLAGDYVNTFHGWYGGAGNDTYLFGRGDGQDIVYDFDTTTGNFDQLIFKAGVLPADILVSRVGDHLILKISGTADQIQINNYFSGDAAGGWALEAIQFREHSDTSWSVADIKALAITGSAANDNLTGYASDDEIVGNAGNDTAYGRGGQDTLRGGLGDDILYGETGDDMLVGDDGNDNMQGGTGDDTFDGGAGNDVLSGDFHNAFQGWYAGTGNDTYLFGRGDGQDTLYDVDATAGNLDKIVFKGGVAPSDVLVVRSGNNLVLKISGTADQIQIHNYFDGDATTGWAIEEIRFTDDSSVVWTVADVMAKGLLGGASSDTLTGYATDDAIVGDDGNDGLYGAAGNDTLDGGSGEDLLYGEAGDDSLIGGAGNDHMHGGAGDDTFDGGAGNDVMSGDYHNTFQGWYAGTGNDTYLFGRGDGQDTVYDPDGAAGLDKIVFKAGVAPGDVQIGRNGDSLVLKIAGTTDQIAVGNYFYGDTAGGWAIEEIRFADSVETVWAIADLRAMALLGGASNDNIQGYATDDTLSGSGGGDTLYGRAGNDTLDGGVGDDILYGEAGNDSLIGDAGNDNMQGGVGDDSFDGGAGNDVMSGDYHNTFQGWYAGTGNDSYMFGRGDGQDTIYDVDGTAGNTDQLVFKAGVAPSDILLSRVADNLVLRISGSTDQVQISNYFAGDGTAGWLVEEIRFTDDSAAVWRYADIRARVLVGTEGNDTLTGQATDDAITGNGGNDSLYGRAGNDVLDGGTGDDLLNGEAGNDSLIGGAGTDNMHGGTGDDTFDGGAGNDVMSGDYHNTFQGWYAGAGNDTYLFGRGDGQDTIYDPDGAAGQDKVVFKSGVLPSDVQVVRSGDSLVLKIAGTTDHVLLYNFFAGDATAGWAIEEMRFTDEPSVVWRVADVKALALVGTGANDTLIAYAGDDAISGNAGNDSLYGRAGNDVLDGGAGDDVLYGETGNDALVGMAGNDNMQGGAGDDTFDGGAGNDVMSGDYHNTFQGWYAGTGNDTYLFGRGDGQDTVYDPDGAAGLDKVMFKAGVLPADVQVVRSGDNLILKIVGTTEQILLANYFASDASSGWVIEEIRFTDEPSTVWLVGDVKAKALLGTAGNDTLIAYATDDEVVGNAGNDTLYGRGGNDVVDGGVGDDVLYGEAGNDTLVGMSGNDNLQGAAGLDSLTGGDGSDVLQGGADDDVLEGSVGNDILAGGVYDTWNGNYNGAGNDTYLFARGDGQDTIYDNDGVAGNLDKIVFKAGIAPADVQVVRSGDHLILKLAGTPDQIQVNSYFANDGATSWSIEQICFTDAPDQIWLIADVKAKALIGTTANETLIGFASDDTIYGGAGGDTLFGRAGNDTLFGDIGNDALVGETGDDSLVGGDGGDVLQGGAGNDTLDGGTGNDVLAGSVYDTWNGNYNGAGNDTYLFGRGAGLDTIYDNDGVAGNLDKVVFKSGVAPADVQVVRSGDNLILKIAGTTDQIQLNSYFASDASSTWLVEQICFTDDPGQVWSIADAKAKALIGGASNDTLIGYATDDTMSGDAGGDTIYGRAGNDTISGDAGNDNLIGESGNDSLLGGDGGDVLQGGAGNDTLAGGTGNDVLAGGVYDTWNGNYNGAGNDTYLFGRGDGQDMLYDNDGTSGNTDQIIFGAGIATNQVQFTRVSNNLVLKIVGTTDQITVSNYFASGNGWVVEEIRFADSELTIIGVSDVNTIVANGGMIP